MGTSARAKAYEPFHVLIKREHLIAGKKADTLSCAIRIAIATAFGVLLDWSGLAVGVNNGSVMNEVTVWAAWDAIDEVTGRWRHFTADYIRPVDSKLPRDLALTIVTANDTKRKRLIEEWPENGILFEVGGVAARYKQTTKSSPRKYVPPADESAKKKIRKPRRTMKRIYVA